MCILLTCLHHGFCDFLSEIWDHFFLVAVNETTHASTGRWVKKLTEFSASWARQLLRGHFLTSSTSEEKIWKTQVFKGNSTKNKDGWTLSHPYDSLIINPIRNHLKYGNGMGLSLPGVPIPGLRGAFFRGVPSKLRPRVPRIMSLGASHMASIQEPLDQRCVS